MRGTRRILLSGALLLSTLTIAITAGTAVAPSAGADPVGTCRNGTPVADPVALKVDGVPAARVETGIFQAGPGAVEWALTICRDPNTHAYTLSVLRVNRVGDVPQYSDLLAEDLLRIFNVTFTPQSGDTPLIAEGHANINSFTIASTVSVGGNPVRYSDIWGNDCNNQGPADCSASVSHASVD